VAADPLVWIGAKSGGGAGIVYQTRMALGLAPWGGGRYFVVTLSRNPCASMRSTRIHDIKLATSLASTTKSGKTGREANAQRATKITGDPRITARDQGSTKREPWADQQQ
jgi:hypothetical protein